MSSQNERETRGTQHQVVGLGEVLWDNLPDGARLGGAPANFACHAARLGADAFLVSAVGHDPLGSRTLERLQSLSVGVEHVAQVKHPTGTVEVRIPDGEPEYDIKLDVAWDHCEWYPDLERLAAATAAVCFGTLFQRRKTSRDTVARFLKATQPDCLRVLDINLRENHFSEDVIRQSLLLANVLKINESELRFLSRTFGLNTDREAAIDELRDRFNLKIVALTCGSAGSYLSMDTEINFCAAEPIKVVDTVGAGDAFTARLVVGLLESVPLEQLHRAASQYAAKVCQSAGSGLGEGGHQA